MKGRKIFLGLALTYCSFSTNASLHKTLELTSENSIAANFDGLHRAVGNIATEPSLQIIANEASSNELPRTVSTLKNDDSGFELTWDNTSGVLVNFFDSITNNFSFFGLFPKKCPPQTAEQIQQLKQYELAEISHHHAGVVIKSGDEIIQKQKTELAKTKKLDEPANTVIVAQDEKQSDWRYNRKWWQRGTPMPN